MATIAPTTRELRRLAEFELEGERVLSVFLDLNPSEFATPPARASQVTSLMHEAKTAVEACETGIRAGLRAALERVETVLREADLAADGTHGVAVFAAGADGLLEVVRLPYPVDPRVVIERRPHVEPLTRAGAPERWAVLLCNRRSARIFQGTGAEGIAETDRIEDDVHSQHDQGGWSQLRYQRGIEKEVDDHLAHASEVLFRHFQRRSFDHVLVAAPQEMVDDVESRLHPYIQQRLAGRLTLDIENATAATVRASTAAAAEQHAIGREHGVLERLREGLGRGERAAGGREAVEAALEQSRVECLLVAEGTDDVEDLIERALEQGGDILVVRHHPDLGPHGGIAALLRF
jgi:peptide chain release factor subunit 1